MKARRIHALAILAAVAAGPAAGQSALADTRARVERMTPQEREQLYRKQQRFYALPEERREELRKFHEQLRGQSDRARLEGVLEGYHAWLATLSPLERSKLQGLPKDQRLKAVSEMRRRELEDQRRYQLPPEDREKLVQFLRRRLDRDGWPEASWMEQWDRRKRLPGFVAEAFEPKPEDRKGERPAGPDERREGRSEGRREGRPGGRRPDADFFRDMDQLFVELSAETRQRVESLGPRERLDVYRSWVWQAMRDMAPSQEELERFFTEKLRDDQRERLLELAPDEMLHELRRLYVVHKRRTLRDDDFGRPRGEGPPGGSWRRRGDGPRGPAPRNRPQADAPPGAAPDAEASKLRSPRDFR